MSWREMDPSAPFGELRREVDRLFDSFVGGVNRGLQFRGRSDPPVNLWEDHECVYAEIEVPGLSMSDIEVHVIGGELSVKGQRSDKRGEDVNYLRQERVSGDFSRSLTISAEVDADKIDAVLKDGVLTVTLPKADGVKPRKIPVKGE